MSITIDTEKLSPVGDNVEAGMIGDKLILVIDTKQPTRASKTGKMQMLASTNGFTLVPGGLKLNLNLGKSSRF